MRTKVVIPAGTIHPKTGKVYKTPRFATGEVAMSLYSRQRYHKIKARQGVKTRTYVRRALLAENAGPLIRTSSFTIPKAERDAFSKAAAKAGITVTDATRAAYRLFTSVVEINKGVSQ